MRVQIHYTINFFFLILIAVSSIYGQKIEYFKVPELEKLLKNPENKLFVVNFWATWCAPCVSELPHFEKVIKDYDSTKVKCVLVSLDFPSRIEKQLIPFLKKNKINLDVAVMMDVDYNSWIDKVDPSWQGNIPSTLFFNNSKKIRFFHPEELDEKELRKLITSYIQ
jgi:thiol-disulfide isomerase/thioredoxin